MKGWPRHDTGRGRAGALCPRADCARVKPRHRRAMDSPRHRLASAMDSITHLFLGGAIVAAIVPARHRRAALLAGAALNTLPDLDVFPLALVRRPDRAHDLASRRDPFVAGAAVRRVGALGLLPSRGGRVAESPTRWWWAILVCLMAHPLIDAFTVYGTQLFWPLPMPPLMWSSLFIIDPLFTLPWLLACVVAWFARERIAGATRIAGRHHAWRRLCRLVAAGQVAGRTRGAAGAGRARPAAMRRRSRCRCRSTPCCGGWWR